MLGDRCGLVAARLYMFFGAAIFSVATAGEPQVPPEETTPEAKQLRADLLAGNLGFRDLLVIKYHPLDVSHVYVYHSERFRQPSPGQDDRH